MWAFTALVLGFLAFDWLETREARLREADDRWRAGVFDMADSLINIAVPPDIESLAEEALETDPSFALSAGEIEALCRYTCALKLAREDALEEARGILRDLRDPDAGNILGDED